MLNRKKVTANFGHQNQEKTPARPPMFQRWYGKWHRPAKTKYLQEQFRRKELLFQVKLRSQRKTDPMIPPDDNAYHTETRLGRCFCSGP